ncbi:hypothetical protein BKA80DRAFT_113034 [Phyllosticta citrichinensis]
MHAIFTYIHTYLTTWHCTANRWVRVVCAGGCDSFGQSRLSHRDTASHVACLPTSTPTPSHLLSLFYSYSSTIRPDCTPPPSLASPISSPPPPRTAHRLTLHIGSKKQTVMAACDTSFPPTYLRTGQQTAAQRRAGKIQDKVSSKRTSEQTERPPPPPSHWLARSHACIYARPRVGSRRGVAARRVGQGSVA